VTYVNLAQTDFFSHHADHAELCPQVPSHIYTFPFEPNPDWSSFYASGPEIWQYIKRTTKKYNLDESVQFNSKIISTVWNDVSAKWQVKVDQKGTVFDTEADILINGAGLLNKWQWPNIQGLHSFKGQLVHTARWDPDLNWEGKKVAIIGNGSSAIQILPELQPKAAKIVTYIRSPTWITANFMAQFTPEGKNFTYTEEERKRFRENPEELFKLRHTIEHEFNKFFYVLIANTPQQAGAAAVFKQQMEERLGHDPELCAKLIPDFNVGCRRLTPGDGYLEALQEPNVRIEFNPIDRVTETGILAQGSKAEEEKFDIIICATGFDVSFSPFWDIVGKDGVRLADQWRDLPSAYFGTCAPNMPNYFIFNGPNCPIAHGSLLSAMNFAADYMMRWCRKIATEDIR
jgi:cation diffusion facilitator CzcD-associated flavoprotein CzcO